MQQSYAFLVLDATGPCSSRIMTGERQWLEDGHACCGALHIYAGHAGPDVAQHKAHYSCSNVQEP